MTCMTKETAPGCLVLVRHGQSQWNLENRFTGWVDVDITPLGEEEARRAGSHLKGISFSRAFTSGLKRAQRTLSLILEVIGNPSIPIEKNDALNERHYGDLQGLDKDETAKKYGKEQVHIWRRSFDVPPPSGESLKMTLERVLPYVDKEILPRLASGENILVVAHGNSLRSIVMELEHLSKEEVLELNIPTAVPIIYTFLPTVPGKTFQSIGDLSILEKRIAD